MDFIELKGDSYELGRSQGEKLKKQIYSEMLQVFSSSFIQEHVPKIVPTKTLIKSLGVFAYSNLHTKLKKTLPAQYKRLNGMIKGTKLGKLVLYGLNFFEVMGNNPNSNIKGPVLACSQIFAKPRITSDGETLIARNFDFPNIVENTQIIRRENPKGRFRNINISFYPLIGSHTGINEKGLYIAINYGLAWRKNIDFSYSGVPPTFLVQEALETCSTVKEAIDFISNFSDRSTGAHFGIADNSGEFCILETTKTRSAIRKPSENGYLFHTNSYESDEIKDANVPDSAIWNIEGMDVPYLKSPKERLQRIEYLINQIDEPVTKDKFMKILADHSDRTPDDFTICTHGSTNCTLCSMIIKPQSGVILVGEGNPCKSKYEEFKI